MYKENNHGNEEKEHKHEGGKEGPGQGRQAEAQQGDGQEPD